MEGDGNFAGPGGGALGFLPNGEGVPGFDASFGLGESGGRSAGRYASDGRTVQLRAERTSASDGGSVAASVVRPGISGRGFPRYFEDKSSRKTRTLSHMGCGLGLPEASVTRSSFLRASSTSLIFASFRWVVAGAGQSASSISWMMSRRYSMRFCCSSGERTLLVIGWG